MKRVRPEIPSSGDKATNGLTLTSQTGRVFTCKTCDREFPSFQALGGHRASHKKIPKLLPSSSAAESSEEAKDSPPKPKAHECSICGVEFPIGQALGGHMRRHRQQIADASARDHGEDRRSVAAPAVPVLKRSTSSKRVCVYYLDLDLHLGPPGSYAGPDNLKLQLMTPLC